VDVKPVLPTNVACPVLVLIEYKFGPPIEATPYKFPEASKSMSAIVVGSPLLFTGPALNEPIGSTRPVAGLIFTNFAWLAATLFPDDPYRLPPGPNAKPVMG
jgi:hypothetical protein